MVALPAILMIIGAGLAWQGANGEMPEVVSILDIKADFFCNDYWEVRSTLKDCRNFTSGDELEADYILKSTENMCRNEESIKQCAKEKLGSCKTWDFIKGRLDESFQTCINGDIPAALRKFLTDNAGEFVTWRCLRSALDEKEKKPGVCPLPQWNEGSDETLEESVKSEDSYYSYEIDCFKAMKLDLDEQLVKCCKKTRRQVYGIMIGSLQVINPFGFFRYKTLEEIITSKSPAQGPVQVRSQLQRALFGWNF